MKIKKIFFLCLTIFFSSLIIYAQNTEKVKISMNINTILNSKIICITKNIENIIKGNFKNNVLEFRTHRYPNGIEINPKSIIKFTLNLPFPNMENKIGEPFSQARLLYIEIYMDLYLGEDDYILVKNDRDEERIDSLYRKEIYKLGFKVDNFPKKILNWNTSFSNILLPFKFSIKDLEEEEIYVSNLRGDILGTIYKIGRAHLIGLELKFVYECKKSDYSPIIKRLEFPDITKVITAKAQKELDKAFECINSIFIFKGDLDSIDNTINFYILIKSIENLAYFAKKINPKKEEKFYSIGKDVENILKDIKAKKIDRKKLIPLLNNIRLKLLQNFINIYKKVKNKEEKKKEKEK